MHKIIFKIVLLIIIMFGFYTVFSTNFEQINLLEEQMLITQNEINEVNISDKLGKFISLSANNKVRANSEQGGINSDVLIVKLFNVFPIRTIPVNLLSDNKVCVGGNAIGLNLTTDGAIIVGFNYVNTSSGRKSPFENSKFKIGDRITRIAESAIKSAKDIGTKMKASVGEILEIAAQREGKEVIDSILPEFDILTNSYKLGLWVRDDAAGVGTLTYVRKDNLRFGALGHGICESKSEKVLPISSGKIYNCDIIGINKGQRGKAGELRGFFISGKNEQGVVDKNNGYGVFGQIDKASNLLKNNKLDIGGRLSAKPGKAKIICCLDGSETKEYDIEIIKTNFQRKSNEKSMVIRVIDKELISKTGGIVQGMSGSPIVQDGKLIGAITHVFVNDPLKGFGIYMDWMIGE